MNFATKYNIGEEVFIMYKNKIIKANVTTINISQHSNTQKINEKILITTTRYRVNSPSISEGDVSYNYNHIDLEEDKMFQSKEDIIKSL